MKYFHLSFMLLCLSLPMWGQDNTFKLSLEYSPNFSNITGGRADEDYKFSHNVFAKSTLPFSEKFGMTYGLGYINTGNKIATDLGGSFEIEEVTIFYNYDYIAMPVGLKYSAGSWFFNPEIAIGINISATQRSVLLFSDGEKEVNKRDEIVYGGEFNSITIPVLLTTGFKIDLNNTILLLGVKGYYSISQVTKDTPRGGHYLGMGIVAGMEF